MPAETDHLKALAGFLGDDMDDDDDLFGLSVSDKRDMFDAKPKLPAVPAAAMLAMKAKEILGASASEEEDDNNSGDGFGSVSDRRSMFDPTYTAPVAKVEAKPVEAKPIEKSKPVAISAKASVPSVKCAAVNAAVPKKTHSRAPSDVAEPANVQEANEVVNNQPVAVARAPSVAKKPVSRFSSLGKPRLQVQPDQADEAVYIGDVVNITPTPSQEDGNEEDTHDARLVRQADANDSEEEVELDDDGQIVFGNPQTFGAAGGGRTDYMPNVRERASAISHWKRTKKDRNGHARAMEWRVEDAGADTSGWEGGEGGHAIGKCDSDGSGGSGGSSKNGKSRPSFLAHFDGTPEENHSSNEGMPAAPSGRKMACAEKSKKVNVPGFLAHFDEDVENQHNGAPSPRNRAIPSSSPRQALSPRNAQAANAPEESMVKKTPTFLNKAYPTLASSPRGSKPPMSPRVAPSSGKKTPRSDKTPKEQTGEGQFFVEASEELPPTTPRSKGTPRSKVKPLPKSRFHASPSSTKVVDDEAKISNGSVSEPKVNAMGIVDGEKGINPRIDEELWLRMEQRREGKSGAKVKQVGSIANQGGRMNPKPLPEAFTSKGHVEEMTQARRLSMNEADNVEEDELENVGEVIEEAMALLRTPRGRHIRVDSVEYDGANPFGSGENATNGNGRGKSPTEELEEAKRLVEALNKLLLNGKTENEAMDRDEFEIVAKKKDERGKAIIEAKQSEDSGSWEGWVETPKNGPTTKDSGAFADDNDGFSFPASFSNDTTVQANDGTGFEAFEPAESRGGDFFFPANFGPKESTNAPVPTKPRQQKSNLTVTTSFNTTVATKHEKKLPKIKICIEGAPAFKPKEKEPEEIFFIAQSSPACGDDATLLGGQSDSMLSPTADTAAENSVGKEFTKGFGKTKRMSLKGFLHRPISHSKESPSAAGLLAAPSNEGVEMGDDVSQDGTGGMNADVTEGQFFAAPAEINVNKRVQKNKVGTAIPEGNAKKSKNLLRRIKAPLVGRNKKKSVFESLE